MPQSIATNTAVALVGRAVQVVLGFAVIAALTRFLGETGFGTYSTLLAYGSLLLIVADLGLYLTFTRESGRVPSETANLLSEVVWLRLAALLGIFLIGSLVLYFFPTIRNLKAAFWVAAAGLAAQSLSQIFMGVFQARSSLWRATVGDIVGRLIQLGAIALLFGAATGAAFVSSGDVVTGMVAAFTAGTLAACLCHLFLLPLSWRLHKPPSYQRVQAIIASSWPAAALLILNAIYFRIDTLLLSLLRPESEVGWYSLAYRIIESALFLPAMFGGLLLPHLSRESTLPATLFQESLRAIVLVGSGVCLVIALLSAPIITFVSGPGFLPAAPLLSILTLALFVMFLGNLFGFTLVARGQQRLLMWLYLGLVVFNIVVNLLTIPAFGAAAAAWVTVATEVIAATVAGFFVYRLTPYTLPKDFVLKLLGVILLTGLGILSLPAGWHVIVKLVLAVALFGGLSISFKLLRGTQFRTLLRKP